MYGTHTPSLVDLHINIFRFSIEVGQQTHKETMVCENI